MFFRKNTDNLRHGIGEIREFIFIVNDCVSELPCRFDEINIILSLAAFGMDAADAFG